MTTNILIFALIIWTSTVRAATPQAQKYVEILADIDLVDFFARDANGKVIEGHRNLSVRAIVGTNEWRMDNNFSHNSRIAWFFDGTNIYHSIQITNPMPKTMSDKAGQRGVGLAPFESGKSNLTIVIRPSSDGHPIGDVGANIPWLAFCSGGYLKQRDRIVPMPVADLAHSPDGFAYTDKTEVFEDEIGLPRKMDLFTSKSRMKSSLIDFNNKYLAGRDVDLLKATEMELEEGIVKFHYEVTAVTNVEGWSILLRFEYLVRKPGPEGKWISDYAGSGSVRSVTSSTNPANLFDPNLQQTIVDQRFSDNAKGVMGIVYASTKSFAEPTSDPTLREKFIAKRAKAPSPIPPNQARIKWVVYVLIVVSALIPLAMIFRHNKRKPTNQAS